MKFRTRKPLPPELPGTVGAARVDRRTSAALLRAHPGDVLVLAHQDMDRETAHAIVARGVVAVVNTRPFISGRYPNLGPQVLTDAGVVLLEVPDEQLLGTLRDGRTVRVHDDRLWVGDEVVASGRTLTADGVVEEMELARSGLVSQLQSFTHNATEFLRREQDVLLHGLGVPRLSAPIAQRPVLVVAGGPTLAAELRGLRAFVAEQRPVVIGVDTGLDALVGARIKAHAAVVGPRGLADASDAALRWASEVVLHTDRTDRVVGAERLEALRVRPLRFGSDATTEDLALLLADLGEASVVVCAGTHATLDEFLDRQRTGLASTFLTRLRLGPRLVDADAIPVLYAGRVRRRHLALVLLVGILALAVAVATTPVGNAWFSDAAAAIADWVDDRWQSWFGDAA